MMPSGWRLLWCAFFALWAVCSAFETTVARPPQGAVRGVRKTSLSERPFWAFYNLPFAKPPVGPLRFKDPQPADTWQHIRDATTKGPICAQKNFMKLQDFPSGSEDCLYLNVFTPKLTGSYPVMFWIHGGGWICGDANSYDPDYLLDHDIVLVTINYRLGVFGFLSTQDDVAPGNFGLKDQVMALQWVKKNIAAFGGDPNSITIFGESAGAASVHYLMLSPLSQGLFHRAISHSGTASSPWAEPRADAADKARNFASRIGCSTATSQTLVNCLRGTDEYEILKEANDALDGHMSFTSVVEGEHVGAFFPKHPSLLKSAKVPWITGITTHEGAFLIAGFYSNNSMMAEFEDKPNEVLPKFLGYSSLSNADTITEKIKEFYFSAGTFSVERLIDVITDYFFLEGCDESVRKYHSVAPTYYYLFSYRGKNSFLDNHGSLGIDLGVSHVDDLLYLFPVGQMVPGAVLSNEDLPTIHTMTKMWTNFAKLGNPTPEDSGLKWPQVSSPDKPEYMEIGKKLKVGKGLLQERVNFWRSLSVNSANTKEEL